jgi:hypothetical protein
MKLLVLSNVSGSTDAVVDALGESGRVVAKEVNLALDAMAEMASEQMKKHSYDKLLVVTKDPMRAGIIMNKQEGINAVVCGSAEDVTMANESGANAIIIKDLHSREFQEMMRNVASSGAVLQGIKLNFKLPTVPRKQESEPEERDKKNEERAYEARAAEKAREKEEREREESLRKEPSGQPRDGVVGKIKDYLGII